MFSGFFDNIVEWAPALLEGAGRTLLLTIAIMFFGTVLGAVLAILRVQKLPIVNPLIEVYVEIFRGLPAIVLLFIAFFGLPAIGVTISDSPAVVGVVALSLAHAAYTSETFRAAILAVDPGQMRAALSLGMSRPQGYAAVVLPQAFLISLPTLSSIMIATLKETSLLSFISVSDLLGEGNSIVAATYLAFQVYAAVGVLYILMSLITSRLLLRLERRLRQGRRFGVSQSLETPALAPQAHGLMT